MAPLTALLSHNDKHNPFQPIFGHKKGGIIPPFLNGQSPSTLPNDGNVLGLQPLGAFDDAKLHPLTFLQGPVTATAD